MCSGTKFYQVYMSLKLHFSSASYDVFKYGGKGSFMKKVLAERNDEKLFEAWGGRFASDKKAGQFILANMVYGDKEFIYQPLADAEQVHLKWLRIRDAMTKYFSDDVSLISSIMQDKNYDFNYMISMTPSGNKPPLMQLMMMGKINIESVIALETLTKPFFDKWDDLMYNDPYAQDRIFLVRKYKPFVKFDSYKLNPLINFDF